MRDERIIRSGTKKPLKLPPGAEWDKSLKTYGIVHAGSVERSAPVAVAPPPLSPLR